MKVKEMNTENLGSCRENFKKYFDIGQSETASADCVGNNQVT